MKIIFPVSGSNTRELLPSYWSIAVSVTVIKLPTVIVFPLKLQTLHFPLLESELSRIKTTNLLLVESQTILQWSAGLPPIDTSDP